MYLSRPNGPTGLIVGHRGLRLTYPDNSQEGILAASAVCDMVEFDVRRTRDGVAVLAHDPQIGDHTIIDTDWPALAKLDLGQGLHPALLDEVLGAAEGAPFNFEIKNSPADPDFDDSFAFAREVAGRASEHDVVTSFHWQTVDAVHLAFPKLTTGLLVDIVGSLEEAVAWAGKSGHRVVAPHWSLLGDDPAATVARLVDSELQVFVWTVNDEEVARQAVAGGATAIITDDPVRIRGAVNGEEQE